MDRVLAPVFSAPGGFQIHPVPFHPGAPVPAVPGLGPLAAFAGAWKGNGFNTIFRPNSPKTPTTFPTPPVGPNDNVLELNLTQETLSFSAALGAIPNRAMLPNQGDAFLNGIPYLQSISDITNGAPGTGIHFEPGLWIAVPGTNQPEEVATVARMASIPHGTSVLAQGTSTVIHGKPVIPEVDITPLIVGPGGVPGAKVPPGTFPSQTALNENTLRLPQNLASFIAAGTITQAMLNDPNSVLRNVIAGQNIVSTTVIQISTQPSLPLFGGGTPNIAFLDGTPNLVAGTGQNAQTTLMSATFWIETVEHVIHLPLIDPAHGPVHLSPAPATGIHHQPLPTFTGTPPHGIPAGRTLKLHSTQIQYSQLVLLKFNGLFWPHVSVATLVPSAAIPIPPGAWSV